MVLGDSYDRGRGAHDRPTLELDAARGGGQQAAEYALTMDELSSQGAIRLLASGIVPFSAPHA
jgi:hypothetical protein